MIFGYKRCNCHLFHIVIKSKNLVKIKFSIKKIIIKLADCGENWPHILSSGVSQQMRVRRVCSISVRGAKQKTLAIFIFIDVFVYLFMYLFISKKQRVNALQTQTWC